MYTDAVDDNFIVLSRTNITNFDEILDQFNLHISLEVDSNASHHAVADKELLINFHDYEERRLVDLAVNTETIHFSLSSGRLPILLEFNSIFHILYLNDVQLVTNLSEPILSVPAFNAQFKTSVTLNIDDGLIVRRTPKDKIEQIASIKMKSNAYVLDARSMKKKNLKLASYLPSKYNIKIKRVNVRKKKRNNLTSKKNRDVKAGGGIVA